MKYIPRKSFTPNLVASRVFELNLFQFRLFFNVYHLQNAKKYKNVYHKQGISKKSLEHIR